MMGGNEGNKITGKKPWELFGLEKIISQLDVQENLPKLFILTAKFIERKTIQPNLMIICGFLLDIAL